MFRHPLSQVLADAAAGEFPPADGQCVVLPPDDAGWWALVAFTGRAYVLGDVDPAELAGQMPAGEAGGFGGVHDPAVTAWVARQAGAEVECGVLDAVLVHDLDARRAGRATSRRRGHQSFRPAGATVPTSDDAAPDEPAPGEPIDELPAGDARWDHPRLARAQRHRRGVRAFADEVGVVALGRGLVDRLEISVERHDGGPAGRRPPGRGRRLVEHALDVAAAESDERWCWAQVAPGNARSLRAFIAAGFVPVGSEQLLLAPGAGR